MTAHDPADQLKAFKPQHDFFVGIDSDGCAFDTMELKHKECFIPNIIGHWDLQAVSRFAREAAEFVNLYSRWRGINRWPALVKVFDLLAERDEVKQRTITLPDITPIRQWIERETKLGNPALNAEIEKTADPVLQRGLTWSEAVNDTIKTMVHGVPPFPFMRESLEAMAPVADLFVVSQTPTEALTREWREHDIEQYVETICGQEFGTKTEHIQLAAGGKYPVEKMLMIGDAPGDMKAAKANGILFYPILPGREQDSWQRFHDEAFTRFVKGDYAGEYEQQLIEEFQAVLPSTPPWQ